MSKRTLIGAALCLCAAAAVAFGVRPLTVEAVDARLVVSPFIYRFHVDGMLEEASPMGASWSPYYWLNSGGRFHLKTGTGRTLHGELPAQDKWRLAYAAGNARDTDNGYHPQNLFRLVTRSKWQNFEQSLKFKINKLHMSASPERNAWSGILLFNRYLDGNNLYYIGVRHDGGGVIKKKQYGKYTTLASNMVFPSSVPYNRDTNPNLIPGNKWIGIKSVTKNLPDGSILLQLWVDYENTGAWVLKVQAIDKGTGGPPILSEGYAGIRTDYMDVEFDDHAMVKIP